MNDDFLTPDQYVNKVLRDRLAPDENVEKIYYGDQELENLVDTALTTNKAQRIVLAPCTLIGLLIIGPCNVTRVYDVCDEAALKYHRGMVKRKYTAITNKGIYCITKGRKGRGSIRFWGCLGQYNADPDQPELVTYFPLDGCNISGFPRVNSPTEQTFAKKYTIFVRGIQGTDRFFVKDQGAVLAELQQRQQAIWSSQKAALLGSGGNMNQQQMMQDMMKNMPGNMDPQTLQMMMNNMNRNNGF